MQDLSSILPGMLNLLPDSNEVREQIVFGAWRKIAGESLSNHSKPVQLDEMTLRVFVSSSRWEDHLKELAPGLVFKINNLLRKETVKRIEFEVREEHFERSFEEETEYKNVTLENDLESRIDSIEDEELRKTVREAAGAYLERLEKNGR